MPSVGGGSSGGGFHGGGSSSGGSSGGGGSSFFFIGGGGYHNYGRNTISSMILTPIVFIIVSAILFTFYFLSRNKTFSYDEEQFQEYAINKYIDVYGSSENEVLVLFVASSNPTEDGYYQICIVGDNIKLDINHMFGNTNTVFGKALDDGLPKGYLNSTLNAFRNALQKTDIAINDLNLASNFYSTIDTTNLKESKIINNVTYLNLNESLLQPSLDEFTADTNITISIYIDDVTTVFPKKGSTILLIFAIVILVFGVVSAVPVAKKIKEKIDEKNNPGFKREEPTKLGDNNSTSTQYDSSGNETNNNDNPFDN